MKKTSKLPNLETSLTEVASLIDKMEHGELTLEQSLHHFERGIVLIKHCQQLLTEAEQKVQLLIEANQQTELSPYDKEIEDDEDDKE